MPLRPALPSDLPRLATISSAAFFNESLFGDVIHPLRHKYPSDFTIYWHLSIQGKFLGPRNRIIVATTASPDGTESITGFVIWQRQGDDEPARKIVEEFKEMGIEEGKFPKLENENNRAIDESKRNLLEDTFPFFKHFWDGEKNGVPKMNNWYLDLCCVHPEYQGGGIGLELVRWGLDRARDEGVHASVTVSYQNEPFYVKAGFDEVVGDCKEGEGNPMIEAKVKGGSVLFMWARERVVSP